MKKLFLMAALALCPLFGQKLVSQSTTGYHVVSQVLTRAQTGVVANVVPYATVSVTNTATGGTATIYSDPLLSVPISPAVVTADAGGNFDFYVPLNYCITETITAPGLGTQTIPNVCQNSSNATGVTSINTVPGAFTFEGTGVTCAGTICTFTSGSACSPNTIAQGCTGATTIPAALQSLNASNCLDLDQSTLRPWDCFQVVSPASNLLQGRVSPSGNTWVLTGAGSSTAFIANGGYNATANTYASLQDSQPVTEVQVVFNWPAGSGDTIGLQGAMIFSSTNSVTTGTLLHLTYNPAGWNLLKSTSGGGAGLVPMANPGVELDPSFSVAQVNGGGGSWLGGQLAMNGTEYRIREVINAAENTITLYMPDGTTWQFTDPDIGTIAPGMDYAIWQNGAAAGEAPLIINAAGIGPSNAPSIASAITQSKFQQNQANAQKQWSAISPTADGWYTIANSQTLSIFQGMGGTVKIYGSDVGARFALFSVNIGAQIAPASSTTAAQANFSVTPYLTSFAGGVIDQVRLSNDNATGDLQLDIHVVTPDYSGTSLSAEFNGYFVPISNPQIFQGALGSSGGSGYVSGDIGSSLVVPCGASFAITAVSGGAVTGISKTAVGGSGCAAGSNLSTTGGSGTGATVTITAGATPLTNWNIVLPTTPPLSPTNSPQNLTGGIGWYTVFTSDQLQSNDFLTANFQVAATNATLGTQYLNYTVFGYNGACSIWQNSSTSVEFIDQARCSYSNVTAPYVQIDLHDAVSATYPVTLTNTVFGLGYALNPSPTVGATVLGGGSQTIPIALGSVATSSITDWTNSGVANGNVPVWNSSTSKWTPGANGFSNPMTTLGDTIYGGASGVATRLAGSTSSSTLCLTETGTGSAATAPTWGSCAGSAAVAFSAITGSTNTSAAMLVGSGASLDVTGTGTIDANKVSGAAIPASAGFLASNSSNQLIAAAYTPTNAAVVPSTAPSAGQILVGNAGGTAYAPVTASGSCTLASTGAFTCSGTSLTLQTNSVGNSSSVLLNMETSTANSVGLTVTPSNPSGGIEKWEITGSIPLSNVAAGASPTGLFDFSAATALKVPIHNTATAASPGELIYDSTNGNLHTNYVGTDLIVAGFPSASLPTSGHCAQFTEIGAWWEITDAGAACGSGGGSGTVTSFSAGNLSPLFSTSVATSTTTPALTFTLSSAAQNSVFAGPATGGSGAPSFQTAPTISAANMTSFPTLNQNTTGSAAKWTTARNLAGNSVDGSANVAFANKFIVQGTTDAGLSAAQFLGALGTGPLKNTTATGVLSIAAAADIYGLWSGTCSSSTYLRGDGSCATPSGSSGLSGMTAGQVPIAATATTITSSEALAGSGAAITTGPGSGVTSGDAATFTGTGGQIADAGFAPAPALGNNVPETTSWTLANNNVYRFTGSGASNATTPAAVSSLAIASIWNQGSAAVTVVTGGPTLVCVPSTCVVPIGAAASITTDGTNFDVQISNALGSAFGSLANASTINNSNWSGTALAIGNGGTGQTTAANALIALFPTASEVGDLVYCASYSSGCTSWALLAGNTSGTKYLQETSAGAPSWTTPSGSGTVNTGTASHLAYYATSTTAVSDMGADFTFATHTLSGGASSILDLSAATGTAAFKVPSTTTNTASAAAVINYDTTNSNYHANSGADSLIGVVPTASVPTPGDIIDASVSSSKFLLHDSGVATANVTQTTATPAANQICVYGSTAKTCTPTTTLPTAAEPAHTGDVTNTAGSLALTVVQVEGAVIPASANVVGTNSSKQLVAATITLDKSSTGLANPTADATFTYVAASTTGLTLAGTAPASVSTSTGTTATTLFNVNGVAGGASSNATGTGGVGSAPTIAGGTGGAGTGTNAVGGAGGALSLTAGNGGASNGSGVNSNGGNITLTPGSPGTGGSGTAGKAGVIASNDTNHAGFIFLPQGTAPTTTNVNVPANSIIETAPTSVTAYTVVKHGTAATGFPLHTLSGSTETETITPVDGTISAGPFLFGASAVNTVVAQTIAVAAGHFTNLVITSSLGGSCTTAPTFNVFDGTSNTGTAKIATSTTQTKGTATSQTQTQTFAAGDLIGIYISVAGATCTTDTWAVSAEYSTP